MQPFGYLAMRRLVKVAASSRADHRPFKEMLDN